MAPNWQNLDPQSVVQLAKILQNPHGESGDAYHRRIEAALPGLSRAIKHRAEILSLFDVVTGKTKIDDYIEPAKLCALHSGLSQTVIHQVFTLLSLEVGHNLNSLVGQSELLTEIQRGSIYNLRELHSLWLPPRDYFKTFGVAHNPKWPFQKSRCEGCILAHVGSDEQAVCELKVVLMSRRRTYTPKAGRPRLMGLVDGWLEGLFQDQHLHREMKLGLCLQGEELKIIRKAIRRKRKERHDMLDVSRKNRRHTMAAPPRHDDTSNRDRTARRAPPPPRPSRAEPHVLGQDPMDDPADSDFENDLIDHYAKLQSSMPADHAMPPCEGYSPVSSSPFEPDTTEYSPVSPLVPSRSREEYMPPRKEPAWLSQPYQGTVDRTRRRPSAIKSTRSSWYTIMFDAAREDISHGHGEQSKHRSSKHRKSGHPRESRRPAADRHAPVLDREVPPAHDRKGKSKARESLQVSANRPEPRGKSYRHSALVPPSSDSRTRGAQLVQERHGGGRAPAPRRRSTRCSVATQATTWDDFCR